MKVMRNGSIVEVDKIEPGDIAIILDNGIPVGHVAIVTKEMSEKYEKERQAMGIETVDDDFDWDEGYEDY